jgi:hypothetical protein
MLISCKDKPAPVNIILDTDIAPDYDDAGALAMLHALSDEFIDLSQARTERQVLVCSVFYYKR